MDGSVSCNHGGTEMGQGLNTKMAQVCADGLGIGVDKVRITATDSQKVPNASATSASSGADINGAANPGFSSSQAEGEIETLLKNTLPRGMSYEWTELSYQDRLTRDITLPGTQTKVPILAAVLAISVLLVILVLAAQYESWSLPMVIVLIVPMGILSALFGVWLSSFPPFSQPGDLNIFTQVALVVLVGLACKNAILIVEFAKDLEDAGEEMFAAVVHACRMRLRPILMTSIAFCAGVIPLILGSGAGSEMRRAMGI
eukprot:gene29196-51149_t